MRYNLVLFSGDKREIARLQAAMGSDCAVVAVNPLQEDRVAAAHELSPHAIVIDLNEAVGMDTVLARIAQLREQFANLPLVAMGDEMSAQMILAAFRAGVNEFVDRGASDSEIHGLMLAQLREGAAAAGSNETALISVLSPAFCEEDGDFALNMACALTDTDRSRNVLLVDLSLPASPARVALDLDVNFTVSMAIREMGRLDRTFLDSALARDGVTGLRVMPLADGSHPAETPAIKDLAALLQVLRANFDVVVVYWGAFTHQAIRAGADCERLYVCCNQRFMSARNAKNLVAEIRAGRETADPILAIHQLDAGMMPAPDAIAQAVGAKRFLALRASWQALAAAHNRGRPLVLDESSPYGAALRDHLATQGLMAPQRAANTTVRLMQWLRKAAG